jgi:hypothetical protein
MLREGDTIARVGEPAYEPMVERATATTLTKLRATGAKVMMIEPVPLWSLVLPDCLSQATYLEECRAVATAQPTPSERYFRQTFGTSDDGTYLLSLDKAICPYLPICDPVVNGMIVKADSSHLTVQFAESLAPVVRKFLDDNNVLRTSG